jgi:hypothetical protein
LRSSAAYLSFDDAHGPPASMPKVARQHWPLSALLVVPKRVVRRAPTLLYTAGSFGSHLPTVMVTCPSWASTASWISDHAEADAETDDGASDGASSMTDADADEVRAELSRMELETSDAETFPYRGEAGWGFDSPQERSPRELPFANVSSPRHILSAGRPLPSQSSPPLATTTVLAQAKSAGHTLGTTDPETLHRGEAGWGFEPPQERPPRELPFANVSSPRHGLAVERLPSQSWPLPATAVQLAPVEREQRMPPLSGEPFSIAGSESDSDPTRRASTCLSDFFSRESRESEPADDESPPSSPPRTVDPLDKLTIVRA